MFALNAGVVETSMRYDACFEPTTLESKPQQKTGLGSSMPKTPSGSTRWFTSSPLIDTSAAGAAWAAPIDGTMAAPVPSVRVSPNAATRLVVLVLLMMCPFGAWMRLW